LQNGLGQALATLLAASKGRSARESDHRRLYDQMQVWLCRSDVGAPYPDQADLMQAITSGDEAAYVQAQSEAIAYLVWLKKFAVAYLSKPEEKANR
jgi:CRISPR-associated protein Cmr5